MYVKDLETSIPGDNSYGPFPKKTTPFVGDKQTAIFFGKLKAAENKEGRAIVFLPRPATPTVPLERPSKMKVGAQVKRNLGTETTFPGLEPLVDWI